MKKIADKGGLVGVVNSIRYAKDLMGVNYVARGSNFDGATAVLCNTSELTILTQP